MTLSDPDEHESEEPEDFTSRPSSPLQSGLVSLLPLTESDYPSRLDRQEPPHEPLSDYGHGGLHPVHINDILDGRFEVIAKLGDGGFATVWLCLETNTHKWRAVKIIKAEHSKPENPGLLLVEYLKNRNLGPADWEAAHIQLPIDHFWIEGPNGRHLALVLPLLGPAIDTQLDEDVGTIKHICLQAAQGLAFLHQHGICHGDFRPSNILLRLDSIDRLGKKEMITLVERPWTVPSDWYGEEYHGPNYPQYLVKPVDLSALPIQNNIAIVDFGVAFKASNPAEFTGIPTRYGAPEHNFPDLLIGPASDLWSLAVTIAEL
ncbi:kinase-like domain-containing protein, partial [Pseudomassariella vexata]